MVIQQNHFATMQTTMAMQIVIKLKNFLLLLLNALVVDLPALYANKKVSFLILLTAPSKYLICCIIVILTSLNSCRYYQCVRDAAGAITASAGMQCRPGYAFDPSLPVLTPCRFTNGNTAYCVKADCGVNFGLKALKYPTYNVALGDIGVVCKGDAGIPDVFRCGANSYLKSDSSKPFNAICELRCSKEYQMAANLQDTNKYYVCYRTTTGGLEPVLQSCPTGQKFDQAKSICA